VLLRIVGMGPLVAGGLVVALAALAATSLLGPVIFWLACNVLDFGHALGLPELGFWGDGARDAVPRRRLVRRKVVITGTSQGARPGAGPTTSPPSFDAGRRG
jgi:hypothetical protein